MGISTIGAKKRTIISFEGDTIKVVRVSGTTDRLKVDQAWSFRDDEFDAFLSTTRERSFVVVYAFQKFFQDTFSLPPTAERYFHALIDAEVKKNSLGVKDYLFFYHVLDDNRQEGKKTRETFVFAVDYDLVSPIIERFDRYNKTIVALYPSVFTLTSLVASLEQFKDDVVLGILEAGKSKILFLIGERTLRFVRFIQSDQSGVNDLDVDNINMTISYFRQTLRVNPTKVVLFNFRESTDAASRIAAPKVAIHEIPRVSVPHDVSEEYIVPLSATVDPKGLARGNLLPPAYRTLPVQQRILKATMVLLLLVTLGCFGSIAFSIREIAVQKGAISQMQRDIAQREALFRAYEASRNKVEEVQPLVAYMNKAYSSPDLTKALGALSFLPAEHVAMESIQMDVKEGLTSLQLKGAIEAKDFDHMDSSYRLLLGKLKKVEDLEIVSQEIDPKDMKFTIEAKWKI